MGDTIIILEINETYEKKKFNSGINLVDIGTDGE